MFFFKGLVKFNDNFYPQVPNAPFIGRSMVIAFFWFFKHVFLRFDVAIEKLTTLVYHP